MVNLTEIVTKGNAGSKYGPLSYVRADTPMQDYQRIPTGIFALDYAIGGGFPVGVTSSIYGPPGGGKTLVMTRLATGAQNMCWGCYNYTWDCSCDSVDERQAVIVQLEGFDLRWAAELGLDLQRAIVAEPSCGEHAADMIVECLKADDCGIVILDSLPMLVPLSELEGSAMDNHVALQARLVASMIRRIKATIIKEKKRGHMVMFVSTNQIRSKIGGFGFQSEEQPGGFTSKHDWHLTVRMSQLKSDNISKQTNLPIEAKFKSSTIANTNKRKIFMLAGSAEFDITVSEEGVYDKGTINDYRVAMKYADAIGVLGRDPWSFGGLQYDKKQDIMDEWIASDEAFFSAKKLIIDAYIARTKA